MTNALIDSVSSKKRKLVTIQQLHSKAGFLPDQAGLIELLEKREEQRKLKKTRSRNPDSKKVITSRSSPVVRVASTESHHLPNFL
jgi:hypothetical protein